MQTIYNIVDILYSIYIMFTPIYDKYNILSLIINKLIDITIHTLYINECLKYDFNFKIRTLTSVIRIIIYT